MSDIEKGNTRRSKTKKGGKSIKKKNRDEGDGAVEDWKLPDQFEDYGVPTDIGKRVVNFSDVDKSVYKGVTEVPFTKSPWSYVFASKSLSRNRRYLYIPLSGFRYVSSVYF